VRIFDDISGWLQDFFDEADLDLEIDWEEMQDDFDPDEVREEIPF
jgi:predicted component of type VI protein secretion system